MLSNEKLFLISNFHRVVNVVCLYANVSEHCLFHLHRQVGMKNLHRQVGMKNLHRQVGMKMGQSVLKRRHIKVRRRGITQKKIYNKRRATDSTEVANKF
jgi:hypothetical protein